MLATDPEENQGEKIILEYFLDIKTPTGGMEPGTLGLEVQRCN